MTADDTPLTGEQARGVIERYYAAMRAGAAGGEEMIGLFADDAIYVEPFTGAARAHVGKAAIRVALLAGQQNAPPAMRLTLDHVEVAPDLIRTAWTCTSPALPHPMRGQDRWTIRDGVIVRLETRFVGDG